MATLIPVEKGEIRQDPGLGYLHLFKRLHQSLKMCNIWSTRESGARRLSVYTGRDTSSSLIRELLEEFESYCQGPILKCAEELTSKLVIIAPRERADLLILSSWVPNPHRDTVPTFKEWQNLSSQAEVTENWRSQTPCPSYDIQKVCILSGWLLLLPADISPACLFSGDQQDAEKADGSTKRLGRVASQKTLLSGGTGTLVRNPFSWTSSTVKSVMSTCSSSSTATKCECKSKEDTLSSTPELSSLPATEILEIGILDFPTQEYLGSLSSSDELIMNTNSLEESGGEENTTDSQSSELGRILSGKRRRSPSPDPFLELMKNYTFPKLFKSKLGTM